MNDKRDLNLSVSTMIEWCGRYGGVDSECSPCNWELYIGDKIIAYNYDVKDGYISKYSATGYFPHEYKLEVKIKEGKYLLTKKYV